MQGVRLPQIVGQLGLESPAVRGHGLRMVQPMALKESVEACRRQLLVRRQDLPLAGHAEQNRQRSLGKLATQIQQL